MSIQVSCPSCKSDVFVDEALAGKDILCPTCKQRMTVPSIAAGRPDVKLSGAEFEEEDSGRGGMTAGPPRWREGDDYDVPARRDPGRWNATVTGLNLIFWTSVVMVILFLIMQGVGLAMGNNPQMMGAQNPQNPPPPEAVAAGLGMMGVFCVMFVLMIIWFIGMCMCCTVPAESGAKGKAITTIVLFALTVVGGIIAAVAVSVVMVGQMQKMGGPPPPGQMPFPVPGLIGIAVGAGLLAAVMTIMWLLFHKAIANYFANERLSRHCVWFIMFYLVSTLISWLLNFLANPMFRGGNVLEAPTPLFIGAQVWGLATMLAISVWYLWINRETKRTILEDQPAAGDAGEEAPEPM